MEKELQTSVQRKIWRQADYLNVRDANTGFHQRCQGIADSGSIAQHAIVRVGRRGGKQAQADVSKSGLGRDPHLLRWRDVE